LLERELSAAQTSEHVGQTSRYVAFPAKSLEPRRSNPRPSGCKKLSGGDGEWRIRVGDYRGVYAIDHGKILDTGVAAIIG
jgi:mRNA-degrading endonuclease RelE of RelBE toxin-antitoxin system